MPIFLCVQPEFQFYFISDLKCTTHGQTMSRFAALNFSSDEEDSDASDSVGSSLSHPQIDRIFRKVKQMNRWHIP